MTDGDSRGLPGGAMGRVSDPPVAVRVPDVAEVATAEVAFPTLPAEVRAVARPSGDLDWATLQPKLGPLGPTDLVARLSVRSPWRDPTCQVGFQNALVVSPGDNRAVLLPGGTSGVFVVLPQAGPVVVAMRVAAVTAPTPGGLAAGRPPAGGPVTYRLATAGPGWAKTDEAPPGDHVALFAVSAGDPTLLVLTMEAGPEWLWLFYDLEVRRV